MLHLAVADLLCSVTGAPLNVSSYTNPIHDKSGDSLCASMAVPTYTFVAVSVIIEMEIALSFAFAQFRCKKCLLWCSNRGIGAAWILGVLVGLCGFGQHGAYGHCVMPDVLQIVLAVLITTSFLIAMAAYAASLYRGFAFEIPGSVIDKIAMRALWYPLNFALTYGPLIVYWVVLRPLGANSDTDKIIFATLAFTARSLNGLTNCLTYACIAYGFRKMRDRRIQAELSNQQQANDDDQILPSPSSSPRRRAASIQDDYSFGFVEFHVAYGQVEVIDTSSVGSRPDGQVEVIDTSC